MRTVCTGVKTSEAMTRERSHDCYQTRPANESDSILHLHECMNARRCKISFLCNTLWVGENRKIERGRLQLCATSTIPATSCEGERSASSLRRLHTYNRASMGQERLSSVALIHFHYQVKIDLDEVVNLFATKHPRRLELGTILRD